MNLRLDLLQLDGVAEPIAVKGTGILTQQINVSNGATTGGEMEGNLDQGSTDSPLQASKNVSPLTEPTISKSAEGDAQPSLHVDRGPLVLQVQNSGGTVTLSSLENNDNPTRHGNRVLYSPNSSPHVLPPSETLVDKLDRPGNSAPRAAAISESSLQSGMPLPPPSRPPASHAEEQNMDAKSLASSLIEALHPVVLQNVQLRPEYTSDKILPKGVQDGAKSLLTDEFCGSFVEKMRLVQQEMQALKTDGPSGRFAGASPGTDRTNGHDNIPSGLKPSEHVPRSTPDSVASTSQNVTRPENQMPVSYLPTPPASGSLLNIPRAPKAMLARENGRGTTSAVAATAGTPKSPFYFPSRKGKGREYEKASLDRYDELPSRHAHVRDHTPESRGIPIPMDPDFFSTPSSSVKEGARRTRSPSPSRSSRYSRPRNVSTSLNYSPSGRRSPSPYHRSSSPRRYRLPPSPYQPTPDRHSSFRHHRSPSPYYHSPPPQYSSHNDGVHSTDRSYKDQLFYDGWVISPSTRRRRHVERSRSRSPSHSRYSIDHAPDATSHTNGHIDTSCDGSKDRPILPLPRPPLDAPPAAKQEGRQSLTNSVQSASGTRGILKPCHNIPGLWFAKTGHSGASIVECEFEVDRETAVKWDLNDKSLQSSQLLPDHTTKICLQLLCLSSDLVKSVYETSNLGAATPEDVAIALSDIKTEWPVQGSLVVEVNSNKSYGRTWLPRHLTQTHPPLDLTGCICEGMNVVRLIQLVGLADKVFVLHAMPSSMDSLDSVEAEQEIIDWADHVQHASLGKQSAVVENTHHDNTLE